MPNLTHYITGRGIQIALGLLWLLDAGLQFQPQMFTGNFANNVIAPSGQGQPGIISGPINFEVHTLLLHPALFNAFFAAAQLLIAVLILWKRTAFHGLVASVVWGLSVWFWGEGLGRLLAPQPSLLMGAPGAALLYAIIALAVLSPKTKPAKHLLKLRPAAWLPLVWTLLWLGGAALQLTKGENTTGALSSMIASMASGAPHWIGALDRFTANLIQGSGSWVIILLALTQALIGLLALVPGRLRLIAVAVGTILSLIFWGVGQSFGGFYTGLATDPNTAPLLILLGVAILGISAQDSASFVAGLKRWWLTSAQANPDHQPLNRSH
jgi:hypothetical protein